MKLENVPIAVKILRRHALKHYQAPYVVCLAKNQWKETKRFIGVNMIHNSLASRLYGALFQRLGSDQHLEIAEHIKDSRKISLDNKTGKSLREIVTEFPWTIESNLDAAAWPIEPTWYEIDIASRLGRESKKATTGFLVLPHPSGPGMYMILTAFEAEGTSARHCFAMAFIAAQDLVENAQKARDFYSKTPDESIERMMSLIGVSMTNDFKEELLIIQDEGESIIEAALRDAAVEMPLLLAILVAQNTTNGLIRQYRGGKPQGDMELFSTPLPTRNKVGRVMDNINRRQSSGFVRKQKPKGEVDLIWYK